MKVETPRLLTYYRRSWMVCMCGNRESLETELEWALSKEAFDEAELANLMSAISVGPWEIKTVEVWK